MECPFWYPFKSFCRFYFFRINFYPFCFCAIRFILRSKMQKLIKFFGKKIVSMAIRKIKQFKLYQSKQFVQFNISYMQIFRFQSHWTIFTAFARLCFSSMVQYKGDKIQIRMVRLSKVLAFRQTETMSGKRKRNSGPGQMITVTRETF